MTATNIFDHLEHCKITYDSRDGRIDLRVKRDVTLRTRSIQATTSSMWPKLTQALTSAGYLGSGRGWSLGVSGSKLYIQNQEDTIDVLFICKIDDARRIAVEAEYATCSRYGIPIDAIEAVIADASA